MPVLVQIFDNPNCESMDAQVFQCQSPMRTITEVLQERNGLMCSCPITGLDDTGAPVPATACTVEDSGDGACYLVVGGDWGLRLRLPDSSGTWDVHDPSQWGVPYLLLAATSDAVR